MPVTARRTQSPRLYRLVDDPEYTFAPHRDEARQRILPNMVADCQAMRG